MHGTGRVKMFTWLLQVFLAHAPWNIYFMNFNRLQANTSVTKVLIAIIPLQVFLTLLHVGENKNCRYHWYRYSQAHCVRYIFIALFTNFFKSSNVSIKLFYHIITNFFWKIFLSHFHSPCSLLATILVTKAKTTSLTAPLFFPPTLTLEG